MARSPDVQLSKSISYALRHAPAEFGLTLDPGGWVAVDRLLAALRKRRKPWRKLEEADLHALLEASEKKRFEIREGRIRAMYGHSVAKRIEYPPAEPPEWLWHGTHPQAAARIRVEGLRPMGRQYVHCSVDRETAEKVARRRTRTPVFFRVLAGKAHRAGIAFYPGQDQTWLCDVLPPEFLERV